MLRNRFYYGIKPFVPRPARLALRRWLAQRKRARVNGTWPIMPGSERPPEGWGGWPDGKKFALVLTHDIEGRAGLDNCGRVMGLEEELGFRSSFNFIPANGVRVSPELRREVTRNGFEVGVHDLHHDGKLFLSEREFQRKAPEINRYLRDWRAVGIRSAFMLRNLDWLHRLEIRYDLSTFDTDPFEPQPQGYHTIFPFWVRRPVACGQSSVVCGQSPLTAHRPPTTDHRPPTTGYAELPYTLPQDSTLFLLLRERRPDIWLQKLDWIATHGGMALVNVHPDYMSFDAEPASGATYSAAFYRRFLEYARRRYAEVMWQPLPREVAALMARRCGSDQAAERKGKISRVGALGSVAAEKLAA